MQLKSYSESIEWMFKQFPSYQNSGALAYKPGLAQTKKLLKALSISTNSAKIIHVAGTNGKGSTCCYLASILTEKNEKVGLFTSPHIFDFRERIRINGVMIEEQDVIDFCQVVFDLNLDFEPSFFEITFAMAMNYFCRKKCSYLIIETGMGGRLDATNVLLSDLSIITTIGLDHTQFLGNTLAEIAREKAGIFKLHKPIVIGQTDIETSSIFKQIAHEKKSYCVFADQESPKYPAYLNLAAFQLNNLQTALISLEKMKVSVSHPTILTALQQLTKNTGYFGRFSKIHDAPQLFLDVSHNYDGMVATTNALKELSYKQLHVIFGATQDKDVSQIMHLFPDKAQIHLCSFQNERSLKYEQLLELKEQDHRIKTVSNEVNEVLIQLKSNSSKSDLILVTGSFFLLGDINLSLLKS